MLQGIVSFDLEVQYLSILRPPPRLLCRLFLLYRSPCPLHVFPVCPQFKAWRCIYCWMLFEAPAKAPVLSESPEVWNVSSWGKECDWSLPESVSQGLNKGFLVLPVLCFSDVQWVLASSWTLPHLFTFCIHGVFLRLWLRMISNVFYWLHYMDSSPAEVTD